MTIKERLNKELIQALKAKKREKAQVLRGLLASFKNAEIEKKGKLEDSQSIKLLRQELRQRKEAIREYKKGKREDLAEKELSEAKIIEKYLPEELSKEEIEKEVKKTIKETKATGQQDIGKVMGPVMARLKGRADGAKVNQIVSKLLT